MQRAATPLQPTEARPEGTPKRGATADGPRLPDIIHLCKHVQGQMFAR